MFYSIYFLMFSKLKEHPPQLGTLPQDPYRTLSIKYFSLRKTSKEFKEFEQEVSANYIFFIFKVNEKNA